jgi:uncharacterized protein YbjT (DUF2867 family)
MTYVITGATGHIGGRLAQLLVANGFPTRVIARDPSKLPALVREGAEIVTGSIEDAATLAKAFAGGTALFWLTPPNYAVTDWTGWQKQLGETAAKAADEAGIAHVTVLSSMGAHQTSGLGPVSGLNFVESAFQQTRANVLALRPGFFMENWLNNLATIKAQNTVYGVFPEDYAYVQVATRDIADVAYAEITNADWQGFRIRGVHGPRNVSNREALTILSKVLGREIKYVRIPASAQREAMLGMGLPPAIANGYAEMSEGFSSPKFKAQEPRTSFTTTPTTLEQWATEVLKPLV